jgi:hypothetical protein
MEEFVIEMRNPKNLLFFTPKTDCLCLEREFAPKSEHEVAS